MWMKVGEGNLKVEVGLVYLYLGENLKGRDPAWEGLRIKEES